MECGISYAIIRNKNQRVHTHNALAQLDQDAKRQDDFEKQIQAARAHEVKSAAKRQVRIQCVAGCGGGDLLLPFSSRSVARSQNNETTRDMRRKCLETSRNMLYRLITSPSSRDGSYLHLSFTPPCSRLYPSNGLRWMKMRRRSRP